MRVEGEHGCAVLVGETLGGLQQRLCDTLSPRGRVHGESPPAGPTAGPAQTLGRGIGVEGGRPSHDAVDLGDDQRAVPRVQLEVEQVLEIQVVGVGSDGCLVLPVGREDDRADGRIVGRLGEPDHDVAATCGLFLTHRE